MKEQTLPYVGRFAPTPSGPLHFGSLVTALGSYFQAKSPKNHGQVGKWLVRIEDIDPPREMMGATDLILTALEAYHLYWDDQVVYQSQRCASYQEQIEQWLTIHQAYYCHCTRQQIKNEGGFYQGHCRHKTHSPHKKGAAYSIRLRMDHPVKQFDDLNVGTITIPEQLACEDFIIKRRDGLFAYNLAVVLDDIAQGVTQIVRGSDLLEPTGRQISLYQTLGVPPISYLHLPLALDQNGNKLSKQNHAPALDINNPKPNLIKAMQFLNFQITEDIQDASIDEIITWGCQHWHASQLSPSNKKQLANNRAKSITI